VIATVRAAPVARIRRPVSAFRAVDDRDQPGVAVRVAEPASRPSGDLIDEHDVPRLVAAFQIVHRDEVSGTRFGDPAEMPEPGLLFDRLVIAFRGGTMAAEPALEILWRVAVRMHQEMIDEAAAVGVRRDRPGPDDRALAMLIAGIREIETRDEIARVRKAIIRSGKSSKRHGADRPSSDHQNPAPIRSQDDRCPRSPARYLLTNRAGMLSVSNAPSTSTTARPYIPTSVLWVASFSQPTA